MIDQPVVRLESNVYGHPLAGLFWELKLEDIWLQEHWENVKRWEYLFPSERQAVLVSLCGRHQDGGSLRKLVLNVGNIAKEDAILAQGSNILCYLTQGEVFLVVSAVLCLCCDPGDCPSLCWCCLHYIGCRLVFRDGWRDGFQTQRRGSWILGRERAERVLAGAIALDGRKEWICKFCSESNVWTRWRCRRCYHNIPAGLRGKYRQAVAAKSGEGSTGSSTSSGEEDKKDAEIKGLRAQIEHYRKQIGGEEQGRQGFPPRRESGLEEVWGLEVEDEIESRKKLDEQRKKLQKELRDVENLSCASKEVQDSLKNDLQQQLQEVEQRRHDLMPEHQKVQKRSQKIQSIEDKRRTFQKESTAAQEEMRKIRKEIDRNEERFRQLSDKFD